MSVPVSSVRSGGSRRCAAGSTGQVTVVGNTLGAYVLVGAVACGIGSIVERSAVLFLSLKLAGAAYLVYLGVKALRTRRSMRAAFEADRAARGGLVTLWEGFVVGVSNPKTIVFFAAVLPQFVDRDRGNVVTQILLLGLVFNLMAVVFDSLWGLTAATARDWFARSPRRLAAIGGVGGLTMIGLGVTVAATGHTD